MTKEKLLTRWNALVLNLECRKSKEAKLQLRHVLKEIGNLESNDIESEKAYLIARMVAMENTKLKTEFPRIKKEAADHCIHVLAALLALYQELPDENDSCKPF